MINRFALALFASAALTSLSSVASADSLKDQLLGAWQLVSLTVNQSDKKVSLFGDNPRGIQIMDADGRFANIITRESLPLYAGNNRLQGTPEEYEAIGKGSNALFGTWEVNEADMTVTFNVEVSTFANWEGARQVRKFKIEDGLWTYINPMTAIGPGNVEVVWKRFD